MLLGTVGFILYDTYCGYRELSQSVQESEAVQAKKYIENSAARIEATKFTPLKFDEEDKILIKMGETDNIYLKGFSYKEDTHRWTEGDKAQIIFPLKAEKFKYLDVEIDGGFFVKTQSVAVLINGEKVAAHFRGLSKPPYTFKISPNQIQDGLVDITFAIKDAISPNAIGIREDTRQIAFRVKSLKITKVD